MNTPNEIYGIGRLTGFAASILFIVAFILTLWPGRRRLATAGVLYAVGVLAGMTFSVYFYVGFARIIFGMSSMSVANSPVVMALAGLIWPTCAVGYAAGAIALLWPSISQEKALRRGKLLHLVIGLPLALWVGISPPSPFASAFGVGWLVYALLWFRIRESYPNFSSSRNAEPAQ